MSNHHHTNRIFDIDQPVALRNLHLYEFITIFVGNRYVIHDAEKIRAPTVRHNQVDNANLALSAHLTIPVQRDMKDACVEKLRGVHCGKLLLFAADRESIHRATNRV